ncbi:MAG: hypothetical protein K0R92_1460 [Lachnospiraceae bacterium]|jgi:hypothetical protein|nr:hypothetical protein [Lachnospiraceae bacterium]
MQVNFFIQRKGDYVKTLIIAILFALLVLVAGCQNKGTDRTENDIATVTNKDDSSYRQNDLVYRDYGTGIKLTTNSDLIISQLDLSLKDDTAIIYVVNLVNNEIIKLCDYHPNQVISYTPDDDGIFIIVAKISNGEAIDLTDKAIVETSYSDVNSNGINFIH